MICEQECAELVLWSGTTGEASPRLGVELIAHVTRIVFHSRLLKRYDGDRDGDLVPRLVPRDREFTQDRKSSHPQGGYGFGEFTRIRIRVEFEICRKLPRTFHGLKMHECQSTTSTIRFARSISVDFIRAGAN